MDRHGPQPFSEIIAAARTGDQQAWTDLYTSVAADLLGYLKARHAPDAEDIVADTFVRAAEGIRRFRGAQLGDFRAWMFRIAHDRWVDTLRKRRADPVGLDVEVSGGASRDPVADEVVASASLTHLRSLIDSLSEREQEVVLLHLLADMAPRQIAVATGRSGASVRVALHRGLAKLRERWDPTIAAPSDSTGHTSRTVEADDAEADVTKPDAETVQRVQ